MARLLRLATAWLLAAGVSAGVVGCPQFFIYDLEEATVDSETVETSNPDAVAALVMTAHDLFTAESLTVVNALQNFTRDQAITLSTATAGVTIHYTIDGSDPNPFSNVAATNLYDSQSPISALKGEGAIVHCASIRSQSSKLCSWR